MKKSIKNKKWSKENPYNILDYYYEYKNKSNNHKVLHFVWYVDTEIKDKIYWEYSWKSSIYYYNITKKKFIDKNTQIISSIAKRGKWFYMPNCEKEAILNSIYININWIEYKILVDIMPNENIRKKIIFDIHNFLEKNLEKIKSGEFLFDYLKTSILKIFYKNLKI